VISFVFAPSLRFLLFAHLYCDRFENVFNIDYHTLIASVKGCLLVLCLDNVQNSADDSKTFCSKAGSSSKETSPDGIKLNKNEMWQFRMVCKTTLEGTPLAICPYLDHYFLVSAGTAVSCNLFFLFFPSIFTSSLPHSFSILVLHIRKLHLVIVFSLIFFHVIQFCVCGLEYDTTLIGRVKVIQYAIGKTRFMIRSLTAHCSRIAVGDRRAGILFFSYDEVSVDAYHYCNFLY
jgi:splicing factor 3B subunit 3